MLTHLRKSGVKDVLVSEVRLDKAPTEGYRMFGSGIAIVNPPWPINVLDDLTNFIADRMPQKAHGDTYCCILCTQSYIINQGPTRNMYDAEQ